MKYLIYGTDSISRNKEVADLVGGFLESGYEVINISDAIFSEGDFLNYIGGENLFGQKTILVLTHCLSTKEISVFLESRKKEIEETQTPIIFVESAFLKKDFPSFKKNFEKISEHKEAKKTEAKRYNVFPLIDAVVSGDKKNSWLLFQDALAEGVSSEEVINLLFWQYKTLALVATGESAGSLGMKPFVFSKSKRLLSKYSTKDLRKKMFELIKLFQESRFEKDGAERLERALLI